MADRFQIVQGLEDKLFLDMGIKVAWSSSDDRQVVTFLCIPTTIPEEGAYQRRGRQIHVRITGDVEIHPGIDTLDGSLELRQWASLLIWCLRTSYDKVYYIFNTVDQLRFK